ncbi:hypothetical protein N7535_009260 [Penicillium sp. DV-2018c]|nr:hypothetical protein N7535_009260 [Penicillium sp. DV-2018c]
MANEYKELETKLRTLTRMIYGRHVSTGAASFSGPFHSPGLLFWSRESHHEPVYDRHVDRKSTNNLKLTCQ